MDKLLIIRLLLTTAVLLVLIPIVIGVVRVILSLFGKDLKKKKMVNWLCFCMILAIMLLRLAIKYQAESSVWELLAWSEGIIDSILKSFRTISLEEEYSTFVSGIRTVADYVIPTGCECKDTIVAAMVVYVSALNLITPIISGAVIFEIIANIFPRIKMFFSNFSFWKEKCYFSGLTPSSLALAKSLSEYYVKTLRKPKPVIIFTDAYIDAEEELEYELLVEAKKIGAICLRDDIVHIGKNWLGKRNFYLTEEKEFDNLKVLTELAAEAKTVIKKSNIYLFVQSDAHVQIEKRIMETIPDGPIIIPVNAYSNLMNNLLVDVPLYEPLIGREDQSKLEITILGNGIIGTEAFLNSYWIGQMLVKHHVDKDRQEMKGCELTINVVSKDTEKDFWHKIDYINPEIKETVEVIGNEQGDMPAHCKVEPYCKVRYIQSDVKIGGFWDNEKGVGFDSDYYIVALGNDADNISIAEKLRNHIGKNRLEENKTSNTVIAYAVFDSELCKMINKSGNDTNKKYGIYMHAFGNLEQVYSVDNIFMTKNLMQAKETGYSYLRKQQASNHLNAHKKRRAGEENSNYNHWADIANAMHIKYKVFSLGWIKTSLFITNTEAHRENVNDLCLQLKRISILKDSMNAEDKLKKEDVEGNKHRLAWLEHRRWCAFTRTMGYRYTGALLDNLLNTGGHKNMQLKLHPCLVEARYPAGDKSYITSKGEALDDLDKLTYAWDKTVRDVKNVIEGMPCDSFSEQMVDRIKNLDPDMKRKICKINPYDFKKYDYYECWFDNYTLASEYNNLRKKGMPRLCNAHLKRLSKGSKKGIILPYISANGEDWIIPTDFIKGKIKRKFKIIKSEEKINICKTIEGNGAFKLFGSWYATDRAISNAEKRAAKAQAEKLLEEKQKEEAVG